MALRDLFRVSGRVDVDTQPVERKFSKLENTTKREFGQVSDVINQKMGRVQDRFRKTEQAAGGLASKFRGLAKIAGTAGGILGGIAAGASFTFAINELSTYADMARTTNSEFLKMESVIKSTGGAARRSAQDINDLASNLELASGLSGDEILAGAAKLLTFKSVQGQNFDRALSLAVDLGKVFGSIEGSAVQLGKALEDPIAGVSALRESGISFTREQRKQIANYLEQNELINAQSVILGVVAGQVGGVAAQSSTEFGRLLVRIENAQKELGTLWQPALTELRRMKAEFFEFAADASKTIQVPIEFFFPQTDNWQQFVLDKALQVMGVRGPFGDLSNRLTAQEEANSQPNPRLVQIIGDPAAFNPAAAIPRFGNPNEQVFGPSTPGAFQSGLLGISNESRTRMQLGMSESTKMFRDLTNAGNKAVNLFRRAEKGGGDVGGGLSSPDAGLFNGGVASGGANVFGVGPVAFGENLKKLVESSSVPQINQGSIVDFTRRIQGQIFEKNPLLDAAKENVKATREGNKILEDIGGKLVTITE